MFHTEITDGYITIIDQWSPVNPEGKKTYDRLFLLELQNNPASQKKPEGLPSLEVVRDKVLNLFTILGILFFDFPLFDP